MLQAEEMAPQAPLRERILYWLLQHPFQSLEDLALALQVHRSSLYRCLHTTIADGLAEVIAYPCHRTKPTSLYYLAPAGIRFVARRLGLSTREVATTWRQRDADLLPLLPSLQARQVLQQMINRWVEHWDAQVPCDEKAIWQWQCVDHQSSKGYMPPSFDAHLMIWRAGQQHVLRFLLDPGYIGDQSRDYIQRRLGALLTEQGKNAPSCMLTLSPLCIITPSTANQELWLQAIRTTQAANGVFCPLSIIMTCPYEETVPPIEQLPWVSSCEQSMQSRDTLMSLYLVDQGVNTLSAKNIKADANDSLIAKLSTRGNFMRRAAALIPAETRRQYQEKEIICLIALRMHRRHLDLLTLLYQYPHQSSKQLAASLYVDGPTVERSLRELVRWRCVVEINSRANKLFVLTRRGRSFISFQMGLFAI